MKKFKVNYVTKSGRSFSIYYDKRKEAKAAAACYSVDIFKSVSFVGAVEVEPHHTAIARGYVGVKDAHTNSYIGKFGVGYVKNYPTLKTKGSFRGNSWHLIEYFIEK